MINEKNYKSELKGICVVEISGESCANCLTLMPILNKLCSKYENVNLYHIEADEKTVLLMKELEISTAPTILIMKDGVEHARARGFQPEEILELWLDAKISELE